MSGRRGRQGRERGACRGVLDKARVGFDRALRGVFVEGEFASGFSERVPVLAAG